MHVPHEMEIKNRRPSGGRETSATAPTKPPERLLNTVFNRENIFEKG